MKSLIIARPVSARSLLTWLLILLLLTWTVAMGCSLIGQLALPAAKNWWPFTWPLWTNPIWQARIGRILAAAAVGAGLGAAGTALQGLLRNPLAEPFTLGISSGAGVGVRLGVFLSATWIAWGIPWVTTPVMAFAGALLTSSVIYFLATHRGRIDSFSLILSGAIVNVFNGAVSLTIQLFVSPYQVEDYTRWAMGELPDVIQWPLLGLCAGLILCGWIWLVTRGMALNMLSLGDEVAKSSGVNAVSLRKQTFVVVGLVAAASVALAGPVSFVGLIVPHACRMIWGPDHRRLLIVSGFVGAILLMLTETACRYWGRALNLGNIPLGMVTTLCGAPFFVYILRHQLRKSAL